MFRTVAEGHSLFARAHQLDPICIVGINHLVGARAVNSPVFDSLNFLYLKIKVTVFRSDFYSADRTPGTQSRDGAPCALNQLGGTGCHRHSHRSSVIDDPNRYIVAISVKSPNLDLRRVILIEFIAFIAFLDIHLNSTPILIAQYRGNWTITFQIPIIVFPVARYVIDGIDGIILRSKNSAGIIPLHKRLADIQIDGVN